MTTAEFAAQIKKDFPEFRSWNDYELVSRWLAKYPEDAKYIDRQVMTYETSSPPHSPDVHSPELSERIDQFLKSPEAGLLANWLKRIRTDSNARVARSRVELATALSELQSLQMQARSRQLDLNNLSRLKAQEIETTLAQLSNAASVAQRASMAGVPFEDYGEYRIEALKAKLALDLKKKENEIELHKAEQEILYLIRIGLVERSTQFEALDNLVARIKSIEARIAGLESGRQIGPEVNVELNYLRNELKVRKSQYDALFAASLEEPTGGSELRKVAEGKTNSYRTKGTAPKGK